MPCCCSDSTNLSAIIVGEELTVSLLSIHIEEELFVVPAIDFVEDELDGDFVVWVQV